MLSGIVLHDLAQKECAGNAEKQSETCSLNEMIISIFLGLSIEFVIICRQSSQIRYGLFWE